MPSPLWMGASGKNGLDADGAFIVTTPRRVQSGKLDR
jgi:hypothetical protein